MVLLELAVASQWKKIKKHRLVKPVIDTCIMIDPDRHFKVPLKTDGGVCLAQKRKKKRKGQIALS